jgi:hypothetical protein
MESSVVCRTENVTIPALVLDDVREGLLLVLGRAAEDIVEVITQPEHEYHPEWFSGSRALLLTAWSCLDTVGWLVGKFVRPISLDLAEYGEVLSQGIATILPCLDDFLREAPENDHNRIAKGKPPEFESLTQRIAGLEFPRFRGHLNAVLSDTAERMSGHVYQSWRKTWISA